LDRWYQGEGRTFLKKGFAPPLDPTPLQKPSIEEGVRAFFLVGADVLGGT